MPNKGFKHSKGSKKKISKNHRKYQSLSTKEKIRQKAIGRKQSPETIAKRLKTIQERYGERKGPKSPGWKGGRCKNKEGYIRIHMPDHPYCDSRKYVKEHRWVVEKHLGRILNRTEHVHHINGIRDDNRIENLTIVTITNHRGEVQCPKCTHTFFVH